jgi:molecular chaperone GrpE
MSKHDQPAPDEPQGIPEEPLTEDAQQGQSQPAAADAQALEDQVAQLTAALQRERADATNIRRRHDEQIASLSSSAKASVVRSLLPVIDNFERALKHVPQELEGNDYVKGIQGIVKQFEKTLADLGVQKIKTTGEPFDPNLHEAVSMEDGDGDEEIVSEELQPGYILGTEVIRHAMVRVKR